MERSLVGAFLSPQQSSSRPSWHCSYMHGSFRQATTSQSRWIICRWVIKNPTRFQQVSTCPTSVSLVASKIQIILNGTIITRPNFTGASISMSKVLNKIQKKFNPSVAKTISIRARNFQRQKNNRFQKKWEMYPSIISALTQRVSLRKARSWVLADSSSM